MGTDIHLYVEKREPGSDEWVSVQKWCVDDEGYFDVDDWREYRVNRNYRLFAMLADVRNGYGFAGVDMGDALVPIDDPRDIPDDASVQVLQKYRAWGEDVHSASWFTVQELMDYDWTQTVVNKGVVSLVSYWEWRRWRRGEGLPPESYSGGIWGPKITHITESEADVLIDKALGAAREKAKTDKIGIGNWLSYNEEKEAVLNAGPDVHLSVAWTEPYYQMADEFLSKLMPKLWRLGKPEDVRIVFWFDN